MKTKLLLIVTMLGLVAQYSAQAEIREAQTMRAVAEQVRANNWVVFDLDNTLIKPAQTLGSDQWFSYLVKSGIDQGLDKPHAVEAALKPWMSVQLRTRVLPVEAMTPRFINELQHYGVVVMGLTARPIDLARKTIQQLASVGIDLSRTAPFKQNFSLTNAQYINGILYLGPNGDKGTVLVDFFNTIHRRPDELIFVDDKLNNVQSLENALNKTQIRHIEYRYGAADQQVTQFNPAIAAVEYSVYVRDGILISDEVAAEMLHRNPR